MAKFDPQKHRRRSIRLKGYDYSQQGLYFVTICCQGRAHRFGSIRNGEMLLNDPGEMVEKWYWELENKYPDIRCREMIVMPNHFHCIIENIGVVVVGADLRVRPYYDSAINIESHGSESHDSESCDDICDVDNRRGGHAGLPLRLSTIVPISVESEFNNDICNVDNHRDGHIGPPLRLSPPTPLSRVIQWFKTMTTNEYIRGVKTLGWEPFDKKLWQRNYYEHIIRNEKSYGRITNYIITNPQRWKKDKFFMS